MSYERTGQEEARLQAEIAALPTKAGVVDAEEDERWGEAFRGDELPEELQRREKRLAAIQAANVRLEAAQRARHDDRGREPGQDRHPRGGRPYKRAYGEPEPKAQRNFTDPQSQIMKTSSRGSSSATTRRWRSMGSTRSSSRLRWSHRSTIRVNWWGCSTGTTRRLESSLRWY